MLVKISEKAGNGYSKEKYNKILVSLRGKWVEVDTAHLFNNQYNLRNYDLRIFDEDITAVRDDARRGLIECGYCGKQFKSVEELKRHYAEERAKAYKSCDSCFWHREHIADTTRSTTKEKQADGSTKEINTTVYIWRKKCTYNEDDATREGCTHLEHEKMPAFFFTEDNTYFLKYPNGYGAYFENLTTAEKWQELKYIYDAEAKTATKRGAAGTYDAVHYFNEDGSAKKIIFKNSHKQFEISGEDFKRIVKKWYPIKYLLAFDDGGKPKKNCIYKDMPQCLKNDTEKYFSNIRLLADEHGKAYYKKIFGVEE